MVGGQDISVRIFPCEFDVKSVRNFIPDLRGQLMDLFTIAWG